MYNAQTLLFGQTQLMSQIKTRLLVPEDFYTKGYTILNGIEHAEQAKEALDTLIANINTSRLPIYQDFLPDIQLAKADIIPVCDDSVQTAFQALHFDMGQPILGDKSQHVFTTVGLYFPSTAPAGSAKTRLLPLRGLLSNTSWGTVAQLEEAFITYAQKSGDGWADVNTGRLQCFARFVDAARKTGDLLHYRDKRMAEWFQEQGIVSGETCVQQESDFLASHGLPEAINREERITLQPGQLLIIDNLRVVHGRLGKRQAQEIYQFMYAVANASGAQIDSLRRHLVAELKTADSD